MTLQQLLDLNMPKITQLQKKQFIGVSEKGYKKAIKVLQEFVSCRTKTINKLIELIKIYETTDERRKDAIIDFIDIIHKLLKKLLQINKENNDMLVPLRDVSDISEQQIQKFITRLERLDLDELQIPGINQSGGVDEANVIIAKLRGYIEDYNGYIAQYDTLIERLLAVNETKS